jgi:nitronate monooxygenase
MHNQKMPELRMGNLVAKVPIVQGGMGVGISRAGLAAAVANTGGIGVIASVGLDLLDGTPKNRKKGQSVELLKREIQTARQLTHGIIGVNVMAALTDFNALVDVSIEAGADVLFMGAGLPLHFSENLPPERLKYLPTKMVPIVSSGRATELIFQYWHKKYGHVPDGVVVEGPLAGGHLGFKKEQIDDPRYALENLVRDTVAVVAPYADDYGKNIPVIAGGGIYTGQDIYDIMQLGAQGVQMATRFVATHECDADLAFKQALIDATKEDISIILSPVGLPGRAIRNTFLEQVESGVQKPFNCPYKCLKTCDYKTAPYCIAQALSHAQQGRLQQGFAFTGANGYRVDKIVSVKELIDELAGEYCTVARAETTVVGVSVGE